MPIKSTFAAALIVASSLAQATVPTYGYIVKKTWPHDPQAFTEGLFYQDGVLYESTGLNGR